MTPYNISPMIDVIKNLGFEPIFVDINLKDFGPDYKDFEYKIADKPSCFLMTYLFGYVPNMDYISKLCAKNNVPLIEDISQNIGANYNGKLLGKFGFASFYSASLTKYVDGYNGAFILLNSKKHFKKVSKLSDKFNNPNPNRIRLIILRTLIWNFALNRYFFNYLTYPFLYLIKKISKNIFDQLLGPSIKFELNKNLPKYYFEDISNIQCSAMKKYFSRLNKLILKRKSYALKALKAFDRAKSKYNIISNFAANNGYTYWQFPIYVTNTEATRNLLFKYGVETGTTRLPNLSEKYNDRLINASKLKNNIIFLPLQDHLNEDDYYRIIKILFYNNLIF